MIFKGGILGGACRFQENAYLNSTTVLFDMISCMTSFRSCEDIDTKVAELEEYCQSRSFDVQALVPTMKVHAYIPGMYDTYYIFVTVLQMLQNILKCIGIYS